MNIEKIFPLPANYIHLAGISEQEFLLKDDQIALAFKINASAAVIWQLCSGLASVQEICNKVVSLMDNSVDDKLILQDVEATLLQFQSNGLVELLDDKTARLRLRQRVDQRFLIVSHRRSGTHLLWEHLRNNYGAGVDDRESLWDIPKMHRLWSPKYSSSARKLNSVYLVRDGRDALVASYHYWRNGGERLFGASNGIRDTSFSAYLRGKFPVTTLPDRLSETDLKMFYDPVGYWITHTQWREHLYTLRFEDLIVDPEVTLKNLAQHWKISSTREFQPVRKLVGHLPRKGTVGDWKNHFDEDDEQYFWNIAGARMQQLGYLKDGSNTTFTNADSVFCPRFSDGTE